MQKKIQGDKVKWGILGVGDVCDVKSAPAMQLIEDSELVAVMRRNERKQKTMPKGIMLPNAIFIATPPNAPSVGESAMRTNWVMEEMTKNYYN